MKISHASDLCAVVEGVMRETHEHLPEWFSGDVALTVLQRLAALPRGQEIVLAELRDRGGQQLAPFLELLDRLTCRRRGRTNAWASSNEC